jgi:uncharacterized protein
LVVLGGWKGIIPSPEVSVKVVDIRTNAKYIDRLNLHGKMTMSLKEKIAEEIKVAMKSGEKTRLETLRSIRAALMEKEIDLRGSGKTMAPEDEMGVLTSAAKKRKESIEQFENGGRKDLAEQEARELQIIQEYLPKQMSKDEIVALVRHIVTETGASGAADFSKVMPAAMKQLKGKADGKLVQEIVKELLGGN